MSEVAMWLFPIGLAALVGLFVGLRMHWQWTWGLCLQQALILTASLLGFAYLYPSALTGVTAVNEKVAGYWAWVAWILFCIFNLGQRVVLNKMSLDLSLFKVNAAQRLCPAVKVVTWGPPADFWCDMAKALGYYHDGIPDKAEELFDEWRKDPRLPKQARDSLIGYSMLGNVLLGNWQKIIDLYEEACNQSSDRSLIIYQMASRAYAEQHRFRQSLRCLDFGRVATARLNASTFDVAFMSFFALSGACAELQTVFTLCNDKRVLPEYVRLYWAGRCHAVRGEFSQALKLFTEAQSKVPSDMVAWRERVAAQIAKQEERLSGAVASEPVIADAGVIAHASAIYKRWRLAAELIRPTSPAPGLTITMVALAIAYVVSNPDQFFSIPSHLAAYKSWNESLIQFHNACYSLGELAEIKLLKGEWWRLLSYMFLHGNTAHLLLNVGALYLFGRSVENIFGTKNYFVLFFGSGILSGLGQAILTPHEAAIGASGAILGIFGAGMASMLKLKNVVPAYVRKSELRWMLSVAIAQVFFDQVINNIAAATDKSENGVRIAAFAHLGGMIAGFALGMLIPTRKFTAEPLPELEDSDNATDPDGAAVSDVNQRTDPRI